MPCRFSRTRTYAHTTVVNQSMGSTRKILTFAAKLLMLAAAGLMTASNININPLHSAGDPLDSFNGVTVYFNGAIGHVSERSLAPDGYNIGLKYQCVEFVKRYYYQRFGHKMPQDRGHAKDYFNAAIPNGAFNAERGLAQFKNGDGDVPVEEDLVVFGPWVFNRFGHVAIVSKVGADYIEVVQQNPGPFGPSRERYEILHEVGRIRIDSPRLLGWLRRTKSESHGG